MLLHFAARFDPGDALLVQRRRLVAQLAMVVALGYPLLAPYQATSSASAWPAQASVADHSGVSGWFRRASTGPPPESAIPGKLLYRMLDSSDAGGELYGGA